jgi:hypothetical protein
MPNNDAKDRENQGAGTRAGGNVETKGASKSSAEPDVNTRAGGNVETKGAAGGGDQQPQPPEQAKNPGGKNSS